MQQLAAHSQRWAIHNTAGSLVCRRTDKPQGREDNLRSGAREAESCYAANSTRDGMHKRILIVDDDADSLESQVVPLQRLAM
jgi:hypothetical protein